MRKVQHSKYNMSTRVDDLLFITPAPIIASMPSFLDWWILFKSYLAAILMFLQIQDDFLPAFQANKKLIRESLTDESLTLAAILQAYANTINDQVLWQRMNIKKSHLEKISSADLVATCNNIRDTANNVVADLLPYGVTAITMGEYNDKIDSYVTACAIPENAKLAQKEATRQISIYLGKIDDLLVKMDGAVFIIRNLQQEFFKKYTDARKLVDPPTFMLSARGRIVDQNGRAIPFARITCTILGIDRRATKNGGFTIKHAPEGIYFIEYSYPGYQTIKVPITIAYGVRAEALIKMEPIEILVPEL